MEIGKKCQEQKQNNYNNEAAAAETLLSPDLGDYRIVYLLHDQSDKGARRLVRNACKGQQEPPDQGCNEYSNYSNIRIIGLRILYSYSYSEDL